MMTRKILAAGIAALALSSCSTITHTSQTASVDTRLYNLTVADMKVANAKDSVTVDWKWNPLSTISLKAQKESATHALLNRNDADVLVEPQYIVTRRGIFRGGSVTVTGYPATYTDFRPMSSEDAEKIATVNGDGSTVVVNPVISTTAGKVVKNRKPTFIPSRKRVEAHHKFVNLIGGVVTTLDHDYVDDEGYLISAMYGSYGRNWGWYGKLTLKSADCHNELTHESGHKWAPSVTFGGIKTIVGGLSAFGGLGIGGYYFEDHEYDHLSTSYLYRSVDKVKFSIPVELGLMMRIKKVNIVAGASYSTPLQGGNGNFNPFAGIGYSF